MILYPQYRAEFYWNLVVIAFSTYIAIWIPLYIVFPKEILPGMTFRILNIISYLIFLLDIFLTIRNSRHSDTESALQDHFNLNSYLKGWLVLDVIALIPFEWLFDDELLALFRLVKLGIVGKIMLESYQRRVNYQYVFMLGFFVYWIGLSAHGLSCGWIAIENVVEMDFEVEEEDTTTKYIKALYWAVTTLTTVGYGDIVPKGNLQIIYTMFVQILGVGLYTYMVGNIAGMLSKSDPARAQYLENIEKLSALIHYRKMPYDLQRRIRDYYLFMWKKRLGYDESIFLQGLPHHLQQEVALYLKKDVIDNIPLFKGAGNDFIRDVAFHLEPLILIPGDYICTKGEIGREMYFVLKGNLSVLAENNEDILATMSDGDFFGEIALFNNIRRTASVRAETYCDIYKLDKSGFDKVLQRFPHFAKKIEEKAKSRDS